MWRGFRRTLAAAGPVALAPRLILGAGLVLALPLVAAAWEVVATGVPRPQGLAVDGQTMIVLSQGSTGAYAGELHRFSLDAAPPIDLSHQQGVRIPFAPPSPATLGSMALDPRTRRLYLGEENGTRIWRMDPDGRLVLYAIGLRRLAAGSALAVDGAGRLVAIDYTDPQLSDRDVKGLEGLEQLKEEDYRGALVFRIEPDATLPLPRRLSIVPPFYPRGWTRPARSAWTIRLLAAVAPVGDDLVILNSSGELFRLGEDRILRPYTRLPSGQYTGAHMVAAGDGSLVVSGGFLVGRVFGVRPGGEVFAIGAPLTDPEGVALGLDGDVYVAESGRHRIVRIRP